MPPVLPVDAEPRQGRDCQARGEFLAAMALLRNAPEATDGIRGELALADGQWIFFDHALQRMQGVNPHALSDVFVTSENLLSVMDRVTTQYSALTT